MQVFVTICVMTREDEIAQRAKRSWTLKSINEKRISRIKQIRQKAADDIRDINILYAEDPERLRAKYAADEYAHSERAKKRAEKKIETEKKLIEIEKTLRQYTLGEEIFTSIVQGIGAALAIVATVLLVVRAVTQSPYSLRSYFITSYACTGASLFFLYIMSTLHHALTPLGAKNVFNKLAHAFVFMTIGTGYSSVLLTSLHGTTGWILFGIIWTIAIVGIVIYSVYGTQVEKAITVLYVLLGWIGIFIFKQLYQSLPGDALGMLLASAITYTVSIPFYLSRKIKFMHCVGSLVMLVAASLLFFALIFQI